MPVLWVSVCSGVVFLAGLGACLCCGFGVCRGLFLGCWVAGCAVGSRVGPEGNGLALSRFCVIYITLRCVTNPRPPVQRLCAVPELMCLTRPYVPKARTLGPEGWQEGGCGGKPGGGP